MQNHLHNFDEIIKLGGFGSRSSMILLGFSHNIGSRSIQYPFKLLDQFDSIANLQATVAFSLAILIRCQPDD
jgi:hypothetical protein